MAAQADYRDAAVALGELLGWLLEPTTPIVWQSTQKPMSSCTPEGKTSKVQPFTLPVNPVPGATS